LAALLPVKPVEDSRALAERMTQRKCIRLFDKIQQAAELKAQSRQPQQLQQPPDEPQPDLSEANFWAQLYCCFVCLSYRAINKADQVARANSNSGSGSNHNGGGGSNPDDGDSSGNGSVPFCVTRDAFERYVARELLSDPNEGAAWLASIRAALLDEHNPHPTRDLLLRMIHGNAAYDEMRAEQVAERDAAEASISKPE
jgi:hypothetical protein